MNVLEVTSRRTRDNLVTKTRKWLQNYNAAAVLTSSAFHSLVFSSSIVGYKWEINS